MAGVFWMIFLALSGLAAVLIVNTLRFRPEVEARAPVDLPAVDLDRAVANLSACVRFQTISRPNADDIDWTEFDQLLDWLPRAYPMAHKTLELTRINTYTSLYRWPGKDSTRRPILIAEHIDVVPAEPRTLNTWTHPPFSGEVADGYIWGRGTLDNKIAVVGPLEAVESLCMSGFVPARDIYFSFTHDEELGGTNGSAAVVAHFQAKGIELDWTFDEGSMVLEGIMPHVDRPVASINLAEKGQMYVELTTRGTGGHSSMPARDNAVTQLARALARLDRHPIPGGFDGLAEMSMTALARHFPFGKRLLFANTWLFRGLLRRSLAQSATSNALLRTTHVATMLTGSSKENVVPQHASATINLRLHPRDNSDRVMQYLKRLLHDENIELTRLHNQSEPSQVADVQSDAYALLSRCFRDVFGDIIVIPGLSIGGTDSRHYSKVSRNSYRINPVRFVADDLSRYHGVDERIGLENLRTAVQFYNHLIRNMGQPNATA